MKRKTTVLITQIFFLFAILVGCVNIPHANQNNGVSAMKRRVINPWTWQDKRGFVQANEITNGQRLLFTAGIVSVDGDGNLLHGSDMERQINQVIDNMKLLLDQADFKLSDVVRFTYYTTDVQAFTTAAQRVLIDRLKKADCKPATSLIGVNSLFHPDCVVEIEAIAMK